MDFEVLGHFYSGVRQLFYSQQSTRVILSKKRHSLRKRPSAFIVSFSSPSSQSFKHAFVFYTPNTPLKEPLFNLISAVHFNKANEHFQQSSWQFSTTDHSLELFLWILASTVSWFFSIVFGCLFSDFFFLIFHPSLLSH